MTSIIQEQGARLMDEGHIRALEARYRVPGSPLVPIDPDSDAYAEIYSRLCDAFIQLAWPDWYQTDPSDPGKHTSDPARAAARVLMVAAGYAPQDD